jgi:hypothetical protein
LPEVLLGIGHALPQLPGFCADIHIHFVSLFYFPSPYPPPTRGGGR